MGTLGWLLVVATGIALGFSVGRLWPGSAAKLSALERERDAAREEFEAYRQEVSTHFARTAHLFDKVTADYRGLYEHLAMGSRQLGAIRGEPVELPLAKPEGRRLAKTEPEPPAAEPPPPADEVSGPAGPLTDVPLTDVPPPDFLPPDSPPGDVPPSDEPPGHRIDAPGKPALDEAEQPDRKAAEHR
jgi:uncharacterized protein